MKVVIGVISFICIFISCSEDTPEIDPYANWELRNVEYIDSIAEVVINPPFEEIWHRYVNYKIQNEGMGTDLTLTNSDYVYVKDLTLTNSDYVYVKDLTDDGVELGKTPFATDTVNVHYRGWFINGEVFDQSYSGDWNVMVHEPRQFVVGEQGIRTGWTTALLHMQEGEHWEVYIPYTMGYGTSDYGDIPAYSTLVFDIRLEKVIQR